MGLREKLRRLGTSSQDLHYESLHDRFASVGDTPIADAPLRVPIKIAGEITRHRIVPRAGSPTLQIAISDGTGEAIAIFTGRRSMTGLDHGRGITLEGVAHLERGKKTLLNPAYTLH